MAESEDKHGGRKDGNGAARFMPSVQAIAWAFVLLILAGYFAWMILEMGVHAVTHAWPMLAVLVAAVAGALAAILGLAIGRQSRDS